MKRKAKVHQRHLVGSEPVDYKVLIKIVKPINSAYMAGYFNDAPVRVLNALDSLYELTREDSQ